MSALSILEWATLPAEVCAIVFSFIPRRPRLVVLSLVCKRWRRVAMKMPTQWYKSQHPEQLLSLLTFTSMVTRSSCRIVPPQSLQLLHIDPAHGIYWSDCSCKAFRQLSSLTSLHLPLGPCGCFKAIVHNNSASLKHLSLVLRNDPEDFYFPHFPSLTSLAFNDLPGYSAEYHPKGEIWRVLSEHCSQLRALSILQSSLIRAVAELSFPALTDLSVSFNPKLSRMPRLVRLSIPINPTNIDVGNDGMDRFSSNVVPYLYLVSGSWPFLSDCANLKVLIATHKPMRPFAPILPSLTGLETDCVEIGSLGLCRNLQTLFLSVPPGRVPVIPLPKLRTLCISLPSVRDSAPYLFAQVLISIEQHCPNLETFGFTDSTPLDAVRFNDLRKFLIGAQSRRLRRFVSFSALTQHPYQLDVTVSVNDALREVLELQWLSIVGPIREWGIVAYLNSPLTNM